MVVMKMTWKPLSKQEIELLTGQMNIENSGCRTCGNGENEERSSGNGLISSLVPTCPTASKNVGDIVHMSARPVGGTAPYTVQFKKGVVLLKQFTGVTEGQIVTYDYATVSADAGLTQVFSNNTTDSCILGAKTCSEQCSITVNAICVPNWQCEQPPNGYMSDGCGNRKLDVSCILPTCGTPICNLIIT